MADRASVPKKAPALGEWPGFSFAPIGFLDSCFKEKFGIPRQAGLVPAATAVLRLANTAAQLDALRGLEGFSHVWVIFVFHHAMAEGWKSLVRPPRMGGARKIGVFATRSPHRPNPIGISVVKLAGIRREGRFIELHLEGGDFLDGTPVLDLKPYVPYADSFPRARIGWLAHEEEPPRVRVSFSPSALRMLRLERSRRPRLRSLIAQMLKLDPRPSFQRRRSEPGEYAARVLDYDIHWTAGSESCEVTRIVKLA